jgi:hypothetical protein
VLFVIFVVKIPRKLHTLLEFYHRPHFPLPKSTGSASFYPLGKIPPPCTHPTRMPPIKERGRPAHQPNDLPLNRQS